MKHSRAFSLVEAAIVLGIVGLVIGGIWAANSAFSESFKISKTVEGMFQIIEGGRKLFGKGDFPTTSNNFYNRESELIAAKKVPPDMIRGNAVISPYGDVDVFQGNAPGYGPSNEVWIIQFIATMPAKSCRRLIAGLTGALKNNNLYAVQTYSGGATAHYTSFPVALHTTGLCPTDANDVMFIFAP